MVSRRGAFSLAILLSGGVLILSPIAVQSAAPKHPSASARPRLISGLGAVHHGVSTTNPQAQKFFDQGLALIYGFNHEAARRCFEYAAELDPKLAMAWWGVALSLGTNINLPVEPEGELAAYSAVQRALQLQENGSEAEKAYINALAFRYSKDPKPDLGQLEAAYRGAMAKLVQHYPDDLDAATLYAESIMNLHPWKLWTHDGRPNEGTEEILTVLESVLQRDPDHLGANHYYVHAVEASPHPERGLASAARLQTLAPASGHLVHMPSHIFARTGDFTAAIQANERAAAADENFVRNTGESGAYPVMYYGHNLQFLVYAYSMRGDFPAAKKAADKLAAHVLPHLKGMPMLEGFVPAPLFVLVAFERWGDILRLPPPDRSLIYATAQWHFGRAMAFAGTGKKSEAQAESKLFLADLAKIPPEAQFDPLNSMTDVARVQENLLTAAIISSTGEDTANHEQDEGEAIEALQHAVSAEDNLNYTEPPSWYPPVRPILGSLLLKRGKAVAAEKVFRSALEKTPRYRPALAGLRDSLKAQHRSYEAGLVDEQLTATSVPKANSKSKKQ
jgi:tetratricopeptide (TPR) repeat protein